MRALTAAARKLPAPLRRVVKRLVPLGLRPRAAVPVASRENVDIVVDGARNASRWLRAAPDTYRVCRSSSYGSPSDATDWVVLEQTGLDPVRRAGLLRPMADPEVAASVLGDVGTPHGLDLWIRPTAMAIRTAAWREVGGTPRGPDPLSGLLQRLRDAGHRIAVRPEGTLTGPVPRTDPVRGAGSAVILAGVPLHDVGGGSRAAQLALELLRHGYHVTYVARFDAAETTDLGLRFIHPRLEQYRSDLFDHRRLASRLATTPTLALVELPIVEYEPVADELAAAGYRTVYDLLDRWSDGSLGGGWYRPEVERRLVERADVLIASAPALVDHLETISARPVVEVPNGVNASVFSRDPGILPADFPPGEGPVLGYHGSLYGSWFDWAGLAEVAAVHPEARVIVIGDAREHPPLPPNVRMLGLKAQSDLPSYLGRFDVGLIPFEVSPTTHAVSPLKAFEYLAMGVPVAAPPLETLRDLDGVYVAGRLAEAVDRALAAPRPDRAAALLAHGWEERLARIFAALALEPAPVTEPEPRVVTRPAVHYAESDRLR